MRAFLIKGIYAYMHIYIYIVVCVCMYVYVCVCLNSFAMHLDPTGIWQKAPPLRACRIERAWARLGRATSVAQCCCRELPGKVGSCMCTPSLVWFWW